MAVISGYLKAGHPIRIRGYRIADPRKLKFLSFVNRFPLSGLGHFGHWLSALRVYH